LRNRGGALINVGSVLSDIAIPIQGTYCASKHAVKGYTDALRLELEAEGSPMWVTLIKPSAINTKASVHPLITGSVIAGLGIAAFAAWRTFSNHKGGENYA
jgi:short-subunit dehydrogenase